MFLTSSAPTSPMRQICAHARSSAISPDVVNGVCPVPVHTPFGEAHGRPKPRSYRPAIVCRPGVGRDLCAVRHWPIVDLRHADGGQFCPWCVLYGRGIDYPLLLTFGLSYVMVEFVRIAFGKTGFPFDTPEILQGAVNIGVGYFPLYRLFVIGATAIVLLALWLFLEKTSFGLIIRAGARDPQIVRVLGVDVAKVWLIVFGIGTAIAGFAGLLAAPLQGVIPE